MSKLQQDVETEAAINRLERSQEALATAPINIVGVNNSAVGYAAMFNAIKKLLQVRGIATPVEWANAVADEIEEEMRKLVDAGLLDVTALPDYSDED